MNGTHVAETWTLTKASQNFGSVCNVGEMAENAENQLDRESNQ